MRRKAQWFVSETGRMRHAMYRGTDGHSLCGITFNGDTCKPPQHGDIRRGALTCSKCWGAMHRIDEVEALGLTREDARWLPARTWQFVGPRAVRPKEVA